MTPQLLIPNAPAAITEQRQHISVTSTVKPVKNNVFVPILGVRELNMLLFSSHPPLIFSSILLFRSLLLTNKLKQHAFVHLTGKLLALACCVLVYLFPPSSLNYLNTPGSCLHCSPRDGGLIRIDLSQQLFFFFTHFYRRSDFQAFRLLSTRTYLLSFARSNFILANMLEQHVILAPASSNRPCHDA